MSHFGVHPTIPTLPHPGGAALPKAATVQDASVISGRWGRSMKSEAKFMAFQPGKIYGKYFWHICHGKIHGVSGIFCFQWVFPSTNTLNQTPYRFMVPMIWKSPRSTMGIDDGLNRQTLSLFSQTKRRRSARKYMALCISEQKDAGCQCLFSWLYPKLTLWMVSSKFTSKCMGCTDLSSKHSRFFFHQACGMYDIQPTQYMVGFCSQKKKKTSTEVPQQMRSVQAYPVMQIG